MRTTAVKYGRCIDVNTEHADMLVGKANGQKTIWCCLVKIDILLSVSIKTGL